jgi:hypothetical protein
LLLIYPTSLVCFLQNFVKAWQKMEESTKDEEGVRIFDLKKPMTDNMLWIGYGEWKTMR